MTDPPSSGSTSSVWRRVNMFWPFLATIRLAGIKSNLPSGERFIPCYYSDTSSLTDGTDPRQSQASSLPYFQRGMLLSSPLWCEDPSMSRTLDRFLAIICFTAAISCPLRSIFGTYAIVSHIFPRMPSWMKPGGKNLRKSMAMRR